MKLSLPCCVRSDGRCSGTQALQETEQAAGGDQKGEGHHLSADVCS